MGRKGRKEGGREEKKGGRKGVRDGGRREGMKGMHIRVNIH